MNINKKLKHNRNDNHALSHIQPSIIKLNVIVKQSLNQYDNEIKYQDQYNYYYNHNEY